MPEAERRRLAKVDGEALEPSVRSETPRRLELKLGGTARPDEIRVVRIREAVRLRTCLGDDGALLEREHHVGRAGERQQRLDRVPALRICGCVALPLDQTESDVELPRDLLEERRRGQRRGSELEVWVASDRERAPGEEGSAKVRLPAARACDDPPRRALERRMTAVDHTGGGEDDERLGVACDVELIPRRTVEGAPTIRPDLGADVVLAKQGEGPPRGRAAPEIEMEPPLTLSAQVEIPGGMEERRQLGTSVAVARRRDARELLADVLGRDQSDTPSSASSLRLTATPAEPYPPMPSAPTTRWHGTKNAKRFVAQIVPTARAAPGRPASAATSP